ncbi:SIS domain-containing protein [soil metagenome]
MSERTEATDFLYPFIEGDEHDAGALLIELTASAEAKAAESARLRETTLEAVGAELTAAGAAMAERFGRGGQLFVFGNGGSATDARAVTARFVKPPTGRPLPARNLAADSAVLTALGNDVGFDLVFSRQLIAHARPDDIAFGLSTSGNSQNLLAAFAEARRKRMLTVGLAGYDGGRMATSGDVDHRLVVRSTSVHRIQETQAALVLALWTAVQAHLTQDHLTQDHLT